MKIRQPYLDQRGPSEGMVPPTPTGTVSHRVRLEASATRTLSGWWWFGHGLPALCPDAWWGLNFPWVNTPLPDCANLQHQLPVGEGKALVNPAVDSGRQKDFHPREGSNPGHAPFLRLAARTPPG